MITTHCPACSGPLLLQEDSARSLVGSSPQDGEVRRRAALPRTLPEVLDEHSVRALRAAIRALEDSAAGVRWRMSRADAPHRLDEELVRLEQDIAVLNELTRPRARPRARAVPATAPRQPTRTEKKAAAPSPVRMPQADVA